MEYFTAKEDAATLGGYTVELTRTGRVFQIPSGKIILEVLRAAGVPVNFSCEQGTCGACEIKVIEWVPDHRDAILTDVERAANNTMMISCSR